MSNNDILDMSTDEKNQEQQVVNITMDPPQHSTAAEDFDIFAAVNVVSSSATKQDEQDLFSFDPFSVDNLPTTTIPQSAGAESDTVNLPLQPQLSETLSPMEMPRGSIVTDNSCANLLDFDLLGSVSEVTEVNQMAQSEENATGNWNNFDALALLGDGTALEPASGTSDTQDAFAGNYMDALMEGDASSPSPLMTPEVGSSNSVTPEEGQPSDPCSQDEEQSSAVKDFIVNADTKVMEEDETRGPHDLSGFDTSEILGEVKDTQASSTRSDEVNPISIEQVDISPRTSSDSVSDISFDQPPQRQSHPSFSKSETVHKVKHKGLEYADSTGSCDSAASYPFTPPNNNVDGFQPVREPFQLKEEALVGKIENSVPSLNIEEVDEERASEKGGERKGLGEGSQFGKKIRGSCSVDTQLSPESTGNYQLSQQQNNQDLRTEGSLDDNVTSTKGTNRETPVQKTPEDTKTEQIQSKNRAFQLALAMELEETAIDDNENDESNIDFSGRDQEVTSAAVGAPRGGNLIDRANGQQIGNIVINDEKDLDIDFATRDIDSIEAVESNGQSSMDFGNVKEIMSADGNMFKAGLQSEASVTLGRLDNFSDDLSPREECEGAFQQQLLPMATNATSDNTGAYQIAQNMESDTPSDDGPVVHSRQNYQDLLSEEELSFDREHETVVTFVNVENMMVETSNSTFGHGPSVNGDITMETDGTISEQNEQLREFVDNFINEEVIPAALETCRTEQEIAQLMENGDNVENGFYTNRFGHENEGFVGRENEDIDIDMMPLHCEELPGNFISLQISGEEGIAENSNIDNRRDKMTDNNAVITEVDIGSQGIFGITTNVASVQITQDVKATQREPLGSELHESDFSIKAVGAVSTEIRTSAGSNVVDEDYNADNITDMVQIGDDQDVNVDIVASKERNPAGDHHQSQDMIYTKRENDDQEITSNAQSDTVSVNQGSNEHVSESDSPTNSSKFDTYDDGKNGYLERHSPTETTGNAVAFHIAQKVMTNNNPATVNVQPNIVIDEYNDDNFNVPKSASTSSWEKESETTDLTSRTSHSTVTSNEGEFIFRDESETSESPDVKPDTAATMHGYDNKSYESSATMSSEEDDGDAAVHGAAVEDGKLVYTAGSDVEAAYKFAQDVIRNSIERYEATKIVKAATDAALEIVKSDHKSSAAGASHSQDQSTADITDNNNSAATYAASGDNEDYPPGTDYHKEGDPDSSCDNVRVHKTTMSSLGAASSEEYSSNKQLLQEEEQDNDKTPPEGIGVASVPAG